MSLEQNANIYCREILDSDLDIVVDLLVRGFPVRSRQYWVTGLTRLAKHPTPAGSPKYGYVMVRGKMLVGVVLLISSAVRTRERWTTRCNFSSWYVEPTFRSYSTLLVTRATRRPDVTYVNISAARHTWRTIETLGFSRYSGGQFVALPRLRADHINAKVVAVGSGSEIPLDSYDRDLLLAHSNYGCLSLCCITAEGTYPFVFLPRIVKGFIPCFQLIYCRENDDYVRLGAPLSWYLASRGRPFVILDANGPIRNSLGRYFGGVAPKYFKGPVQPRLGDLAFTEAPMFGL